MKRVITPRLRKQRTLATRKWRKNNPDKVRAAQDRQNEARRLKRAAAAKASEERKVQMSPSLGQAYVSDVGQAVY